MGGKENIYLKTQTGILWLIIFFSTGSMLIFPSVSL